MLTVRVACGWSENRFCQANRPGRYALTGTKRRPNLLSISPCADILGPEPPSKDENTFSN